MKKNIEPTGFPGHDESFLTIIWRKICISSND